ncbi:hypothetical protein [Paenibacillus sp.]|uniref:hyaluronate lyase N-terminal domain-containing protein n=1 Tax=Paenibacillus sp. TaxID=58172 RepID=UPI0028ACB8E8|nr:hypothetical protein [Paenibacillus sp.]
MAQTIQIKRGMKAELTSYGVLKAGELGFCSDTKEVYIGDGTSNSMEGRCPGPKPRVQLQDSLAVCIT